MKTVFMGTPDFAADVLEHLYESSNEVCMVFTQPDRAKDRGKKVQFTPVKELALKHNTIVIQPERIKSNQEVLDILKNEQPDIIVVAAYGQILPEEVLNLPKYGCINVHASLLPKLRGASPIQMSIVTGEKETGVTIMQMAKGLDTGDMLSSASVEIGELNASQLTKVLSDLGGRLLIKTMDEIVSGQVVPKKQDDSKATYAGLILKKDGEIDFNKTPEEIERLIRGFDPWPGAFCQYDGQPMKFWKAVATDIKDNAVNGSVVSADNEGLKVVCGGKVLIVTELQAPGKKRMKAGDYLRGHNIAEGTVLY